MPYRVPSPCTPCEQCDRPAAFECLRCGRPLCRAHFHGPHARCQRCEKDFARLQADDSWALEIPDDRLPRVLLLLAFLPLGLANELHRLEVRWRRRRFLRERPVAYR